jgi:hypothetical protein
LKKRIDEMKSYFAEISDDTLKKMQEHIQWDDENGILMLKKLEELPSS